VTPVGSTGVVDETSVPKVLAAIAAVARDLDVAAILRRVVYTAREFTGARGGVLTVLGDDGEVIERVPAEARTPREDALKTPIRVRGRVFAVLHLEAKADGSEFGEYDLAVLTALSRAAAVTIENTLLFEDVQRRERWLEASYHVTEALLTEQDLTATLRLVADRARVVGGGSVGAIARPSEPGTLVFNQVEPPGEDADRLAGLTVPIEGTATGMAFSTREPVVVRDYGDRVTEQQGPARLPAIIKDLDSAVSVPLVVGDDTLGVLVVAKFRDRRPFSEEDVRQIERFAGHAALAVEFARVQEVQQRLAVFEDRDRIARDLHDLVIQRLFATGLGMEGTSRLITDARVADRVAGYAQDLDRIIREIRNSIFSLQAPAQAQGSLRAELLRVALDAGGVLGFEPRVGFDGPLDAAVPDAVRSDLLACLREALSNVGRHAKAGATSVEVTVDGRGHTLTLAVTDDGIGIPEGEGRRSGLANLSARAARWGGTCVVVPGAAGGTRLTWTAELPPRDREETAR